MYYRLQLVNHLSFQEVLDRLRQVLTATHRSDGLALLEQALDLARQDTSYATALENAFMCGSTVQWREVFSAFGSYFAPPRAEYPFYPHADAVNWIDASLGAIQFDLVKPGALQEHIHFINNDQEQNVDLEF